MSGHSKWHTIKHKKGAADAKRGKVFTRIIKELTVAARNGGGDVNMNPRLRTIVAAENSVAWMFSRKGQIVVEKGTVDEEKLLTAALDAGADDMNDDESGWEIVCAPENFEKVRDAVKALGVEPASAEVAMIPQNYVKLTGKEAQQMLKLMEIIEEHDDVQHVWANFDIEEKEIEASLA